MCQEVRHIGEPGLFRAQGALERNRGVLCLQAGISRPRGRHGLQIMVSAFSGNPGPGADQYPTEGTLKRAIAMTTSSPKTTRPYGRAPRAGQKRE